MKKNLEIIDFEDKQTKDGKAFVRFKTSEGWMSCFDEAQCALLKTYKGKISSVETAKSGDFQNIKKCYGRAEEGVKDNQEDDMEKPEVVKIGEKPKGKFEPTSMYVSYAKDIFCQIQGSTTGNAKANMNLAIELIKQAKEAFE